MGWDRADRGFYGSTASTLGETTGDWTWDRIGAFKAVRLATANWGVVALSPLVDDFSGSSATL